MDATKVSPPRFRPHAACAAATLAVAGFLACGTFAHAQEPGVIYEPGSPSDKEYAIPLEEARKDAGGEQPGRLEMLPFGIGLSSRGGGGGSDAQSNRAGGSDRRAGSPRRGAGGDATPSGRVEKELNERLAEAEEAGAPALWRVGTFVLLLLPALLVGLLIALRSRGPRAAPG